MPFAEKPARKPFQKRVVPEGLPARYSPAAHYDERDILLTRKQFHLVMSVLTGRFPRISDHKTVAKRLTDNQVLLSLERDGQLIQEVITVPESFSVRAYRSKIGG